MQDLYRRRRRADLHGFLHQVVGHAVKAPVEHPVIEFVEKFFEVLARELPFEWLRRRLPVVLKIEQSLRESIQILKIVGRENLSLDDREVDLNLV